MTASEFLGTDLTVSQYSGSLAQNITATNVKCKKG
jgi:hypothetical protein